MTVSACDKSFYKNDLVPGALTKDKAKRKCPVKGCTEDISGSQVPFQKNKSKKLVMVPFCPEHGLRIHQSGFVYYNGTGPQELKNATRRNINFNKGFYKEHFLDKAEISGSNQLCFESSEDALSFNVFTELLTRKEGLKSLVSRITGREPEGKIELHLWGGKIDLAENTFSEFQELTSVMKSLDNRIHRYKREPDIMLRIPGKLIICFEAKLGGNNSFIGKKKKLKKGTKPKKPIDIIRRYCNNYESSVDYEPIFIKEVLKDTKPFYEQLFRNIVLAAEIAALEGHAEWYTVNLRCGKVISRDSAELNGSAVEKNIKGMLQENCKSRFSHITWEELYEVCVKDRAQSDLKDLAWYMQNKTLNCSPALILKEMHSMKDFKDIAYGSHPQQVFDLWLADSPRTAPLIIQIHGGAFRTGSKDHIDPDTVEKYLEAGISVAAIEYRLREHAPLPAAYEDCAYALQYIRSRADEWNINKNRIGAYGGSAGAQLVMYLGFHAEMAEPEAEDPVKRESTRLAYLGPVAGQTTIDMPLWEEWIPGYSVERSREELFGLEGDIDFTPYIQEYSAMDLVGSDSPPVYMYYSMGPNDPIPEDPEAALGWQVHSINFGIKLKEKMDALGLESYLSYPGCSGLKYNTMEDYFIAKLL